jgi:hypothetical protein
MGNEARVTKEIKAAVVRLASAELPAEVIERAALDCLTLETAHVQLQTNINQQFDQLLRGLGAELAEKTP